MIDQSYFGVMSVGGEEHRQDLIVFGPGAGSEQEAVQANWRRREGHELHPEDLDTVAAAAPRVLVIGRGVHGRMVVPDHTLSWLRGIEIEAVIPDTTGEAAEAYNDLVRQGVRVVGAFHLTC